MLFLKDIDLTNKRVLVREDFNVPLNEAGQITSEARLRAALPTLQFILKQNAALILLSHLGRPQEGSFDSKTSLAPVASRLSELLNKEVTLKTEWLNPFPIQAGEIILCENVRFNVGEKNNDPALAKRIAALGDIFVMDAFAVAHRREASTYGVAQFSKIACAGLLLQAEIEALSSALINPRRPLIAIVGGSKISSKLTLLKNLLYKVDQLIVGGGIANTLLAAQGITIGASLCEKDLLAEAGALIQQAAKEKKQLPLPTDVVVSDFFSAQQPKIKKIHDLSVNDKILDIGPETAQYYASVIHQASTVVWNGPVGVFEQEAFSKGTQRIAEAIGESGAFSIAGGGDTLAAIDKFHIADKLSYISTGGGAFLEFLEGKSLPGIKVLG